MQGTVVTTVEWSLSTPMCTLMTASNVVNTPYKLATTPIGAQHDYSSQQTMIYISKGSRMSPLSLGDAANIYLSHPWWSVLPVVDDSYKYPIHGPTDSNGCGGSYSPTEDAHMAHGSLQCTNISTDLLMSPDSQPSLSTDMIGYSSHYGNSNLDNLLATSCGNTTNLTSFNLNSVSVSDILSEVQASLNSDIVNVAASKIVTTGQCNLLSSVNATRPSAQSVRRYHLTVIRRYYQLQ